MAAGSIVSRIAKAVSIMAHSMTTTVVRAEAAFAAIKPSPLQIAQTFSAVAKTVSAAVRRASRTEKFYFQSSPLTTVYTRVIKVAYTFSIDAIPMVTTIVRAWNSTVTT